VYETTISSDSDDLLILLGPPPLIGPQSTAIFLLLTNLYLRAWPGLKSTVNNVLRGDGADVQPPIIPAIKATTRIFVRLNFGSFRSNLII
jgi:hypothetical protein